MKSGKNKVGIMLALLAAALYAINSPLSKILLDYIQPTVLAGLLYLGAGLGMAFVALVRRLSGKQQSESKLTRADLPYTVAMIVLDIIAPILLMFGLKYTAPENASLLNNFEIVATAVIALCLFKEKISPRLWCGIALVTIACALISVDDIISGLEFSGGSLLVLGAALCWGIENNCTRRLSSKDPMQIVLLKGLFSGGGSLAIGFIIGERIHNVWSVPAALGLGLVAYGMSIFTYVYAQRLIGAARTGAYYAIAPFISVFMSCLIFADIPTIPFFIALIIMAAGAYLSADDKPMFKFKNRRHKHE